MNSSPIKQTLILVVAGLLLTHCAGSRRPPDSGISTVPKVHLSDYKRQFFNLYSKKDDVRLGEYFMELQIKEFKRQKIGVDLPKHSTLKSRVEEIVKKIAVVSDNSELPYEVHIFDMPKVVNAFCMPGGKIGVFTGLFDREKGLVDENNDDQIAAVIGHEIAHATLRHVTRRLTKLQGFGFLGNVASLAIGQGIGQNAQYIFEQVFSLGATLYLPSYSRKYERDADQAGFYYLARAGFNPQAAIDIWSRAAERGGKNSKKTDFFASHPASGVRAKTLEMWLPEAQEIWTRRGQY